MSHWGSRGKVETVSLSFASVVKKAAVSVVRV